MELWTAELNKNQANKLDDKELSEIIERLEEFFEVLVTEKIRQKSKTLIDMDESE